MRNSNSNCSPLPELLLRGYFFNAIVKVLTFSLLYETVRVVWCDKRNGSVLVFFLFFKCIMQAYLDERKIFVLHETVFECVGAVVFQLTFIYISTLSLPHPPTHTHICALQIREAFCRTEWNFMPFEMSITQSVQSVLSDFIAVIITNPFICLLACFALFPSCFQFILGLCLANKV